jgi:dTDP-3,4-didehydro-2,6-dideoxy-alpha-D-glucose 3-reductase
VHLLILGYSSIVRRRVLPAALATPGIAKVSIASRRLEAGVAAGCTAEVAWFSDYATALADSGADVAYVSGPNAAHREWTVAALERGLHAIVDKPAFLDLETSRQLVTLARAKRRGLAEATVFSYHPQVSTLQSLLADEDESTVRASMTFCLPARPAGDFRMQADAGGGSLYDLGPYVAAVNRVVFRKPPSAVHCSVLTRTDVDTSFGFLLAHGHGGAVVGHCGFDSAYQNRLSLVTRTRALQVERIYSPPPDRDCAIHVAVQDAQQTVSVPRADAFACFLRSFADAIEQNDFDRFEQALLDDAALLQRLRQAAGIA